jgi:hypothetical protein
MEEILRSPAFWIGGGIFVIVFIQFVLMPALGGEPQDKKKKGK